VLLVHLDHDPGHRFCVPTNDCDVIIGQCLGLIAEQLPASSDRNRLRLPFRMIWQIHGAPLERESQRFVLAGCALWRVDMAVDAPSFGERGCGVWPASSAGGLLRAATVASTMRPSVKAFVEFRA
jgi:hypothetical protein